MWCGGQKAPVLTRICVVVNLDSMVIILCFMSVSDSSVGFNTAARWPVLRGEQFRKIGNLNHYPWPLFYYVCKWGLEGGQISIVWKSN